MIDVSDRDVTSPSIMIVETSEHSNVDFESIAATLGFIHHEGTDLDRELDVIKCILIRESIIMKLVVIFHKISQREFFDENPNNLESELLISLSDIRMATTTFIELLSAWRQSASDYEPHNLKTFLWEGRSYALKVTTDLDFLSDQPLLVAALHFPSEKMIKNPLMLPNNLEEGDTWISAMERAVYDSGGLKEGSFFEERLRIRKAERVLLQELELNVNEDIVPEWDVEHHKEHSLGSALGFKEVSPNDSQTTSGYTTGQSSSFASSTTSFSSSVSSSTKDSSSSSPLQKWKYDFQEQIYSIEKLQSNKLQELSQSIKEKNFEIDGEVDENDTNFLDDSTKIPAPLSSDCTSLSKATSTSTSTGR